MDTANLNLPEHYINRELSVLEFNRRVLALAKDESAPVLERLKFLCIVSTNLDEFFEIRVSGLKQRLEAGAAPAGPDMLTPAQALREISESASSLVNEQYKLLNETLIPEMKAAGISFVRRSNWSKAQRKWLRDYFHREIVPTLSPISLDPARPFPLILNKSLNFIVGLDGIHAFGRPCNRAIVQAPRSLPRLIRLSEELPNTGDSDFVFLSSIIHAFVDELFVGMKVTGCYQFRVTRNSDLYVDEEEVDNLLRAIEGELTSNRYGAAVRIEVAHNCPEELTNYLLGVFELDRQDLYQVEGPVNLNRLMAVYDMTDREELKYPGFTPGLPNIVHDTPSLFRLLREQDLLLQHPYESFGPVLDMVSRAATDPTVVAIKMTLYRAGHESPIVDHLVAAAKAGKEVTVVVELRARFDEASNIAFANRLQEVGAHVVHGVVGFKTHCKMMLIVRREGDRLKRYAHLGTGNYHPGTARVYTDYSFFTSKEEITEDVHHIFLQLTSMTETPPLQKVIQAPFGLHEHLLAMIDQETSNAKAGKTAHIVAKLNALVEPEIIQALYRASCAGVMIDLTVRGLCCLRPGLPGISDNIRVRSIVGRFLEHSRVYYFYADGAEALYCASADWMDRNVFRRVELCFPIEDASMKKRLISDLDLYLQDNQGAWELQADGSWNKVETRAKDDAISVQTTFLTNLSEQS
jgi:polyphosphate kinase